jgi:hypothetical protein
MDSATAATAAGAQSAVVSRVVSGPSQGAAVRRQEYGTRHAVVASLANDVSVLECQLGHAGHSLEPRCRCLQGPAACVGTVACALPSQANQRAPCTPRGVACCGLGAHPLDLQAAWMWLMGRVGRGCGCGRGRGR